MKHDRFSTAMHEKDEGISTTMPEKDEGFSITMSKKVTSCFRNKIALNNENIEL